jgi:hypothetical protein
MSSCAGAGRPRAASSASSRSFVIVQIYHAKAGKRAMLALSITAPSPAPGPCGFRQSQVRKRERDKTGKGESEKSIMSLVRPAGGVVEDFTGRPPLRQRQIRHGVEMRVKGAARLRGGTGGAGNHARRSYCASMARSHPLRRPSTVAPGKPAPAHSERIPTFMKARIPPIPHS